jgi:site-specific DNA-methyltransferase (adenine-specific)
MINKVLHGDCLEIMKTIPDGSVDMILCDLPYGTTACKWDVIIPFNKLWEQYERIVKPNGAVVLFGAEPFSSYLRISNIKMYKYDFYWKKTKQGNFAQAPYMPLKNIETLSIFSKGKIANNSKIKMNYFPQGLVECNKINNGGNKANQFRPNRTSKTENHIQTKTGYPKQLIEFDSSYEFLHPTQKPVSLFEYLINTYTKKGDVVLDNCAGSGTTAIACINTNRNYILIEKEKKYFDIINERIDKHNQSRVGEVLIDDLFSYAP